MTATGRSLRIVIAGAGRMGHSIADRMASDDSLVLLGVWRRNDDLAELAQGADVIIDFSLPAGTEELLPVVQRLRLPLVCGVSGLDERQTGLLDAAALHIPVVYDRNMSQGVTVLEALVRQAAAALGQEFTVLIEETHHIHKKDAPSGTALKLGEAVAGAHGGRDVAYKSERVGEVPGDHAVIFRSGTEMLRLEHSVTTRDVFADGALRAARWIVGRPPGRYAMRDVLLGA